MKKSDRILIAGSGGMVGSSLAKLLKSLDFTCIFEPTRKQLDYTDQRAVNSYLERHSFDVVIIAAAKVGGIYANSIFPAEFLYQNLMIACNLIHGAHLFNINRLLYLGSTCIYPKEALQPISESSLLSGPLEETNEAYALSKICGVKLCEFYNKQYDRDYISAMPTNLYGPKDNYHPTFSHVIPALIRRFHEAKENDLSEVSIWGTGKAKREFLYVEDLAEACLFLLKNYHGHETINVGSEEEYTISETAKMIAEVVGYRGEITTDLSKPDGTLRKKTDLSKMKALGWMAKTSFKNGLIKSYEDFLSN